MDPDFGHWLAGFLDGEGCFAIKRVARKRGDSNWYCLARIELRNDDLRVLEEIQLQTGLGKVWTGSRMASWAVTSKKDCVGLIEILDQCPLRAKKARDYEIWREAVIWWVANVRRGGMNTDWGPMAEFDRRIKEVRAYAI